MGIAVLFSDINRDQSILWYLSMLKKIKDMLPHAY